ncbi:MAG: glycerophosphodiester phosphodiesterase family protein [Ilumatobacteraceae bacterium]
MKVVAHRGASSVCPENTMAAFRRAIDLGADGIEFDVQATIDGGLVVVHDLSLERTTNGHGSVFAATLEEVRSLDAGAWFGNEHAGEKVPTLSEVLTLGDVEFELELKGYGEHFVDSVLDAVRNADVLKRVEFTGSNVALLLLLKRREPAATIGMFSTPQPAWMSDEVFEHHIVGVADTSGADVVHVHAACITARIVDRLHELSKIVHANDALDAHDLRRALASGADRLSTNDVALAIDIVRSEHHPARPGHRR